MMAKPESEDIVMQDPDQAEISDNSPEPDDTPQTSDGSETFADRTAPKPDVKLEDLLDDEADDDDDDDEFSSSGIPNATFGSNPPLALVKPAPTARYTDPDDMLAFYQRLFPFRLLFRWLNHAIKPGSDFSNREFAFTLQNDAYLRYQSFASSDLLRKDVLRLNPSRFEIGPVYSAKPRDRKTLRKSTAFRPVAKELVFDIDLTDYDEIRTCCDKANICHKCWSFVTMAIKVVDTSLREDFGFKHILWVYSGRRGAHAWISDKRARSMDDQKRKALAGYLELVKGGSQSGKKVNIKRPLPPLESTLHPHLTRSLNLLREHFQTDILKDQDPWSTPERASRLLQLLPDKTLNEALRKKWDAAPSRSSASKWSDIDALAKSGASKNLDTRALFEAKQDIVLEYTYPRLDVEVSKKQIHLLKSPFVIHPGTGRVCVPIDVTKLEAFDPLGVPTVTQLLQEIDGWKARADGEDTGEGAKKVQDHEKTSLKPYIDLFRMHVDNILSDEEDVKRERDEQGEMEF